MLGGLRSGQNQSLDQTAAYVQQRIWVRGPPVISSVVQRRSSVMHSNDNPSFLALDSEIWAVREKAFNDLFNDGAQAVATLVAGAAHRSPKVRASCVALMDHLADERCCKPLEQALRDSSPLVRRHAVHAVGCQRCKVRPLSIDVVAALIDRVLNDSSPRVRRVAVHQFGLQPRDMRAIDVLTTVIAESQDTGIVSRARHALALQQADVAPRDAANSGRKRRSRSPKAVRH